MTWIFKYTSTADSSLNLAPATGGYTMYYLKEMLKQGGVTAKGSSDGSTYNATTDIITTGASGAGGFGNTSAWWRGQLPDGREIVIQRGTTNLLWGITMSHSSTFITGSPSTTRRPAAADEKFVCGGGTDASPTYLSLWQTDNTYKINMGMDNAAPYDFWCIAGTNATGATNSHIWLLNMASGSYPTEDVAPYVMDANTGGCDQATLCGVTVNSLGMGQGYYKKGLSGEAWVNYRAMTYAYVGGGFMASPAATTFGLGVDPYNGKDTLEDILVCRLLGTDTSPGRKGRISTATLGWADSVRITMQDYVDTVDGKRYAYFGQLGVRYSPNIVPVR